MQGPFRVAGVGQVNRLSCLQLQLELAVDVSVELYKGAKVVGMAQRNGAGMG